MEVIFAMSEINFNKIKSAGREKEIRMTRDYYRQRKDKIESSIKKILYFIGEDPDREGLLKTPERMIRSWETLFGGYDQDPEGILKTRFSEKSDEMIILRDIELYSTCEHHFLPFFGKACVGYIPDKQVIGISKIARLVECFARRLQIQERLTNDIARALDRALRPKGVAVVIRAKHLCMMARGVEKQNSEMMTNCLIGAFKKKPEARAEFFNAIK